MTKPDELKACPFCGGSLDVVLYADEDTGEQLAQLMHWCPDQLPLCKTTCNIPIAELPKHLAAWNRRAEPRPVVGERWEEWIEKKTVAAKVADIGGTIRVVGVDVLRARLAAQEPSVKVSALRELVESWRNNWQVRGTVHADLAEAICVNIETIIAEATK